jgi:hypothetical protein
MFVRRKKVKGNIYYQLVRNSREAGKHKQKVLCHLGRHRSLEAAIAAERELAEQHQGKAAGWSNEAKFLKEDLIAEYGQEIGNIVPSRQQAYFRWRAFRKEYKQKFWQPYDQWSYSWLPGERVDRGRTAEEYDLLYERQRKRRTAEREQWEERRYQWEKRKELEVALISAIYYYHDAVSRSRRHEKQAVFHRAELNKFLEAKQKYCT